MYLRNKKINNMKLKINDLTKIILRFQSDPIQ